MYPPDPDHPQQDPASTPSTSQGHALQALPRVSVWAALGLSIISLGLYYTYWLFTRTQIINRVTDKPIPMILVHTVLGLLMLNLILSFVSGYNPDNEDYQQLARISGLVYSLFNLFWVFTLRQRLHKMTQAGERSLFWINGIWTFLFQVLYLQFKINEYIEEHSNESSLLV
ncbi:MAG TPA: DUF4234 domain-containing protein [Gammaproteobacteria bacterium]